MMRYLKLPEDAYRLEEVNLPPDLLRRLVGETITVEVVEAQGESSPARVHYADASGRTWNLPRRWLPEFRTSSEPPLDPSDGALQEASFEEVLHLPTAWDLQEVNVPKREAMDVFLFNRVARVQVHLSPGRAARVFWRGPKGVIYRLPHDWRRRLIQLPELAVLVSQQIPESIAKDYARTMVSVNYHPDSLCCLPEQYRFRDAERNPWPVRIRDCVILGQGNAEVSPDRPWRRRTERPPV